MPGVGRKDGGGSGGYRKNAGRKKGVPNVVNQDIKTAAAQYLLEGLRVAVAIMRKKRETASTRLRAVEFIFDRALGKPAQAVTHAHSFDLSKLNDDELELLERIGERLAGAGGHPGGESPPALPGAEGDSGTKH